MNPFLLQMLLGRGFGQNRPASGPLGMPSPMPRIGGATGAPPRQGGLNPLAMGLMSLGSGLLSTAHQSAPPMPRQPNLLGGVTPAFGPPGAPLPGAGPARPNVGDDYLAQLLALIRGRR